MRHFFRIIFLIVTAGVVVAAVLFVAGKFPRVPSGALRETLRAAQERIIPSKNPVASPEQLYERARERSSRVRALYMTADVANAADGTTGARLRERIIGIATTTEINGLVIDVKEVCGPDYDEAALAAVLKRLGDLELWRIARIVAFKDASRRFVHPEWYLSRRGGAPRTADCRTKGHLALQGGVPHPEDSPSALWQDNKGGYWMDPAHPEVRRYILNFSRRIADLGFDELQFDYIRFPSDGDTDSVVYPFWDGKVPKYEVMRDFFGFLARNLRLYKPDIILSADLFGYAAIRAGDAGIGQRLDDIGDNFDYVSFMVYPSHFYSGLELLADRVRGLAALHYSYEDVRAYPGIVVSRSLGVARAFFDGVSTSSAASVSTGQKNAGGSVVTGKRLSRVRLRPWLEDFFHEEDRLTGRPYGAEKVRLQIDAAEGVEQHGWLLWNAANIYTAQALHKDEKTR